MTTAYFQGTGRRKECVASVRLVPRDDIHYKVAITEGAKQLEAGELRKAESHFRFAVKRCAECAGGYRGLAKVFIELDDRARALEILREGAQSLARSNNRGEAIE